MTKDSAYPSFAVLVVDDDQHVLDSVRTTLKLADITNIKCVKDSTEMLGVIEGQDIGVLLLDLGMPGLSGDELIPLIRQENPGLPIVVITGNHTVDKAVECMKAGVDDYLTKPVETSKLVATVRRFIEIQELRKENSELSRGYFTSKLKHPEAFSRIPTVNSRVRSIMQYVEAISRTASPVLITGETGVGKDLFARAIHSLSGRSGEFVAVNTAGLDDPVFSDVLFGHLDGAFTGATSTLKGLVARAANGTLFLDEIGDLSHGSQVKLLRLLESGEYYPLGSDVVRKSNARIVVATNKDLPLALKEGGFRKDLFFRLKTHQVHVPPLRDRMDDIAPLVSNFVEEAARELGVRAPLLPDKLFLLLKSHRFPGNVRELRSMVFDAMSRHDGSEFLSIEGFKSSIAEMHEPAFDDAFTDHGTLNIKRTVDQLVERALESCQGNIATAARALGITPQALRMRLKRKGN